VHGPELLPPALVGRKPRAAGGDGRPLPLVGCAAEDGRPYVDLLAGVARTLISLAPLADLWVALAP